MGNSSDDLHAIEDYLGYFSTKILPVRCPRITQTMVVENRKKNAHCSKRLSIIKTE